MTAAYCYVHSVNSAWVARVNQTAFTYPIAEVTYDGASGSESAIEVGMTVLFGTSAGADDLGRQRIRKAADASKIYFGRSSRGVLDGEVALENDAHITVLIDWRPWMVAPFIDDDGTIYKDHDIAYSDQNEDSPPVANAGPDRFGTIDSGTSKLRLTLPPSANTSFATADGASISSYQWTLPGGASLVSGALTDSQITVDCDPGSRYFELEVTDSNGKTATARVFNYTRDPDSDTTIPVQIEDHRRTPEGQEISIRLLETLPTASLTNGTRVVIWEGEPSGPTDTSHQVFSGWHMSDPEEVRAGRTGLTRGSVMRCGDIAAMMRRMPAFPVEIIGASSPSNWGQMVAPNMDKYLHFLMAHHTNVLELADWTDTGTGSNFPFVILGSDGESMWDQVQSKAKALVPDYVLTCNRLGQLQTVIDPMLQDSGSRTATVQKALDEGDISDISWEGQAFPRVHWVRGEAILADADDISALFCIAPGTAPGQGLSEQPSGEQLAQSQADLNACEGHRYARLNAPYSYFTIMLAGADDFDIEPANLTWVTATLGSSYASIRSLTLSSARFIVHELTTTWEQSATGLVKTHELLCELETEGEPAETVTYDETDFPDPDYDPPPDPGYDPDPGPGGENDGFGTNYVWTDSTLGRTRDLSALSPSWSDITPVGVTDVLDFILDPWAPQTTGYLLADNSVYKSIDLDQASPSFSQILTTASIESGTGITLGYMRKIVGSINAQGFFMFIAVAGGGLGQVWAVYTDDGGSTWSYTNTGNIGAEGTAAAFDIVPHLVGGNIVAYVASNNRLARTTNGGQSWSLLVTGGLGIGGSSICLHCPYDGNESGNIAIIAGDSNVLKYNDGTSTYFGAGGTSIKRHAVETYTQDAEKVVLWTTAGDIKTSDDGGSSFTTEGASGLSGTPTGAGGFPFDSNQYYVITSSGIFVSTDGGGTFTDKTGDWAFGFSNTPYKNGVVPLWVAE